MDNGTLDNTSYFNPYTDNTIDLMDLKLADSTTFLFTFTDENGLEVEDAIIHTYRDYIGEGLFREVERSKQDSNGETHMHLVEEDVIYYFMVTQYGEIIYTSSTYNAKCLSTPCSIELSASADDINWDIVDNEGGNYAVSASKATRLVTLDWNLLAPDLINMSLYVNDNNATTYINSTSSTGMAGSMDLTVPISYGNATYFVVIYRNNTVIKSEWVDMRDNARDIFGVTGAILAGLIVLTLLMMSVAEGIGLIIFVCFGLILIAIMQLVDLGWLSLISIIGAGFIIIFRLVARRKNA